VAVETLNGNELDKLSSEGEEYAASTPSDQTISETVPLDIENGDDGWINIPHSLNHQPRGLQKYMLNSASPADSTPFNFDFSASGTPDVHENFGFDTFLNSDDSYGFPFTAFGTGSTTDTLSTLGWGGNVTLDSPAPLSQASQHPTSPSKRA
jgi:hypothetical protein